ncbi:MAG TPA: hypothetical protein PLH19_05500 [Anaerolineae bacterium]|nr:hypothetical protein [Anaerolineae bacterium]HQH37976.1 hypothetical protein [Anaerolineae bacterium]
MPTHDGNSNAPSAQPENENVVPGNTAGVDLQALAEKIVALLKEELRVENERRGRRLGG